MKWKHVYVAVYLLLNSIILTGCGNINSGQALEQETPAPVIRIGVGSYGKTKKDMDIVNQELSSLSEEKIGVRMMLVPVGKNTSMLLNDIENPVDIVCLSNEDYIAQRKSLCPIDGLLYQYGVNIIDLMGEDMIVLGKYENILYGIPKPMPDVHCTGVALSTKYLKKYRIDTSQIHSMADFEPVLEMIKENEPDLISFVPERPGRGAIGREVIGDVLAENLAMVYYDDPSMTVVNMYGTPEYEARVRMVRDWYLKGYLGDDILTNMELGLNQVYAELAFSTEFVVRPDEQQAAQVTYGDKITYVSFSERPYLSTSSNTVYFWTITKQCGDEIAAMKAMDLLYTDEDIISTILYGAEGIHYVDKEDGHITYPEGVGSDTVGYVNSQKWRYNRNKGKIWDGVSLDLYDIMKEFNASAIKSPAYGFQFDGKKLSLDPSKLSQTINDYSLKLGCGVVDVETALPEFRQKLKERGADLLVEEVQEQVDAWKSKRQIRISE
ncbi:MAG TPA: ABC transporter substrate-binding protein [Clostridiales bacterium]|nr:ABC transporter substrate-binding protein [Clostridiales bacterium]